MRIKTKHEVQLEQQLIYNLTQIFELFPQYTMAQHFLHFLRRKSEKDPYFWSGEMLLKKVEEYYDELKNELVHKIEED